MRAALFFLLLQMFWSILLASFAGMGFFNIVSPCFQWVFTWFGGVYLFFY